MNILWEFYFLRMESICALYDKIMSISTWLTVSWVKQPEGRCSTERAFIVQQMRREDETMSAKIRKKLEKRGILICRLWCEKPYRLPYRPKPCTVRISQKRCGKFIITIILASSFYNSRIPLLYFTIVSLSLSLISITSYTEIYAQSRS